MNGIGKQAAFYCGYLPDDRSLVPLTVLLSDTVDRKSTRLNSSHRR